ncbi:MAG: hypothetical protein M0R17_07495 [Candidatus Omnitrophica bacterium]|jgi:hypothetical protein|nr:hypothetical protein [Candidatus Omnitrophota bacterium]
MKEERIYFNTELKRGKCTCCGIVSNEILVGDGRCIDCIEEENFFNETMKHINRHPYDGNKTLFDMWT